MKVTYQGELRLGTLGEGVMEPKEYLEHKETLDLASKLDKFDMFANINVIAEDYEKTDADEAGIERIYEIHGDGPVIFEHQSGAAEDFLKRLRGIGILADEVGMGKTFEAGIVLAELANVVKLRSLLIVARNMADWADVMKSFGIDKILMVKTSEEVRKKSVRGVPSVPMMMDTEDFRKFGTGMRGICFDAIVVDEAHNLGDDGMGALSVLMKAKNEQNSPYCILVSGTPHKGNLENLFPLWYFFYKKGVNFERFDRMGREKFEYTAAKKYFIKECCHGAKTIAEFVDKSWELYFTEGYGEKRDAEAFRQFAAKVAAARKREGLPPLSLKAVREKFIALPEQTELRKRIEKKIGNDYNNNLIGSFMIRQSRTKASRNRAKKARNYYFCPLPHSRFEEEESGYVGDFHARSDSDRTDGAERKAFRYRVKWSELFTGNAVERYDNGEVSKLESFAKQLYDPDILRERDKERVAETRYKEEMCDIMFATLEKLGAAKTFSKRNSVEKGGYYHKNFAEDARARDIENIILFVDETADRFQRKAEEFARILQSEEFSREKVVVFFDHDVERTERNMSEPERLYRYLQDNPKYSDLIKRIVFFGKDRLPNLTKAEREKEAARVCSDEFREKEAAVLFLAPPLGEGFNFQYDCHTVVNFSISADPVKTDQSIGRVDRIGQTSDMIVVSLADMDQMEGYVLSFYNRIKMFSAWQSDIILVSGCNSETAVKQCPKCNKIVLATDGQSEYCDNCGVKFGPLKGESYECDLCDFRLVQEGAANKVHNYAYLCKKREKLSEPFQENSNETVFMCDKACAVMHCTKLTAETCEVKRLMKKGIRHKDLVKVCRVCRRQGLNTECKWCSVEYDVFGKGGEGLKPLPFYCAGCRENSCRDDIFRVVIGADGIAKCPECEKAGRDGTLRSNSQKTFQAFVKKIWEFRSPDGAEDFVSNFSGEVEKVRSIIDTLANS